MFPFKTLYWAMLWCNREMSGSENSGIGHSCPVRCCALPKGSHGVTAQWVRGRTLALRVWWWTHSFLGGITFWFGGSVLESSEGSRCTRFSLGDLNSTCSLGTYFNHRGVLWFSKASLQITWSWSWISWTLPTYQDSSWRKRRGSQLSNWWPFSRWHNSVVQIYVTSYFSST